MRLLRSSRRPHTTTPHPRGPGTTVASLNTVTVRAQVESTLRAESLYNVATEIEAQTVRWIAELLGYPAGGDGLLVSGGNMANLVGLTAARAARSPWDTRAAGLHQDQQPLCVYASTEAHTSHYLILC